MSLPQLEPNIKPSDLSTYSFSSNTQESSRYETWGVASALRPTQHALRRPGDVWKETKERLEAVLNGGLEDDAVTKPNPGDQLGWIGDYPQMFATVNNHTLRVYHARPGHKPRKLIGFPVNNNRRTEDEREKFYAVAWAYQAQLDDGTPGKWYVAAAGQGRVVRVFDLQSRSLIHSLPGHSNDINGMAVHPRDGAILATASKDSSIRLWNLRSGTCIAIIPTGIRGHQSQVITLDFDLCGHRLASCSIDNSVRIWNITADPKLLDAIIKSHEYAENPGPRTPEILIINDPAHICRRLHRNYVDCVAWVGDALVSKSVHGGIIMWLPGPDRQTLANPRNDHTVVQEYLPPTGLEYWYVRFGLDRRRRTMAIGGLKGVVYLFRLDQFPAKSVTLVNKQTKCNAEQCVRQVAFSDDGSMIFAVDDAGCVAQFDREGGRDFPPPKPKPQSHPVRANRSTSHATAPTANGSRDEILPPAAATQDEILPAVEPEGDEIRSVTNGSLGANGNRTDANVRTVGSTSDHQRRDSNPPLNVQTKSPMLEVIEILSD